MTITKAIKVTTVVALLVMCVSCDFLYNLTYPDATVEVSNESGQQIIEVHIALQADTDWGANRISTPILSGSSTAITGILKNIVKVKVLFDNNAVTTIENIDLTTSEVCRLRILPKE